MARVADHHDLAPGVVHLGDLDVHLGHQRAGRVEHPEAAPRRLRLHGPRHAVGAEHHRRAGRHLVELVDEDRALGAQVVDDELVVDDLVPHVDRRAELREGLLDDGDRAVDAGAEAAGIGQDDVHQAPFAGTASTRRCRKLSRIRRAAPTVIALSATLNAG